MTTKKTEQTNPDQTYYLITSEQYLFLDPQLSMVLYPGVSGVVTSDQLALITDFTKTMLTIQEISEQEFTKLFSKQGIMGVIRS